MGSSLFFMSQDGAASLANEAAYRAESDLQRIVADNPQLLMRDPSSIGNTLFGTQMTTLSFILSTTYSSTRMESQFWLRSSGAQTHVSGGRL